MTDFSDIDWSDAATAQKAAQAALTDISDTKTKTAKKSFVKKEQDFSKYFTTNLPEKDKTGTKSFRMLPCSADPYQFAEKVYFHYLKVDSKWLKIYDPSQNGATTDESPLNNARKALNSHANEEVRKSAMKFKPKLFYIIRGIDRDATADGVKFWRFGAAHDGKGPMDKIESLITVYNSKKPGSGAFWNPTAAGRDLIISINRDEQKKFCSITNIIVGDPEVLSTDDAQATAWLNDPIKWSEVFKINNPLNYLDIIAQGLTPVWDREANQGVGGYLAKETPETAATVQPVASAPVAAPVAKAAIVADEAQVVDLLVDLPF